MRKGSIEDTPKAYVMYELLDTGQRSYVKDPYHINIARVIVRSANTRAAGYARYWLVEETELPSTEQLSRLVGGASNS